MSIGSPTNPLTSTRGGLFGLAVTLVAIALVEVIHRFILDSPGISVIVLLAVVFTTFVGGVSFGLVSCALLALATAWRVWPAGGPATIQADDVLNLACMVLVPPVFVLLIGALQEKTRRLTQDRARIEADQAARERDFAASENSRAEHRNIFNSVPAMIWFKDRDGNILRANLRAAESIGRRIDQVLGKSTWDLYPEQAEKYQRDDAEVIGSGRAKLGIIERYETPDGKEQWVRTDKIPFRDDEGNIIGVIVFAVDITDQKAEQEALHKALALLERNIQNRSEDLRRLEERLARETAQRQQVEVALLHGEERFRTIINNTAAVVYMKDLDGRYVLTNRRFDEIFDFQHGSVIGKLDSDLFPPDVVRILNANDQDVLAANKPIQFEEWVPQQGGMHAYISLKFPMYDVHGKPSGICGISTDITDRKRAEEETIARLHFEESVAAVSRSLLARATADESLQEALRHLLPPSGASRVYLFENIHDPQLGLCMRQTHEICAEGVKPEIDNPVLQRLPYAQGLARWQRELSQGRPVQGVVDSFPPEERAILEPQLILSILVLPIWSAGEWYGFIGFDEIRTRRVWTEADVRLLRTAAEMIGAYLARERNDAELRHAKEQAEAASRAKTQLLANMSHEIRNPLMAMMGWADRARRLEGGRKYGEVILRNGRYLKTLLNNLLDLSRIDAGQMRVQPVETSLVEILLNVLAQAAPAPHQQASVEVSFRYLTPIPSTICTDPLGLAVATVNLLNNALKFTERGHVHVVVAVDRDGPEPRLSIQVQDTGRGIPEDQLEHVFEAFAQVGAPSGRLFEGVGLGLPISRWLAEHLGGSLAVQSKLGSGSTFTLRVATGPLDDVEWIPADKVPALGDESSTSEDDELPRVKGRVLLAEDAADAREVIAAVLTDAGATVTEVGDGQQAVAAFQAAKQPFDLILLDIWMPIMDGLAAVTQLRKLGHCGPVIALTALSLTDGDSEHLRILEAGFDEVWGKPMEPPEVARRAAPFLEYAPVWESRGEPTWLVVGRASFLSNLPDRMATIKHAFQCGNSEVLADEVHKLVGVAGCCGYMPISVQARKLETMLKKGMDAAKEELPALEQLAELALRSVNTESQGSQVQDSSPAPARLPAPP